VGFFTFSGQKKTVRNKSTEYMQETQHTQQKDTQTAQDTVKHRNSMDATLI